MSIKKGNTTISGLGLNGTNGVSPVANVSKNGAVSTITITDANGTTTTQVLDGENYAYNITSITGSTLTLTADTVNTLSISEDTYFTLPTITDSKFHQIIIFATITNSPNISWGTLYYFNNEYPTIEDGDYNFIFEYDGTNWYAGAIKKGVVA